MEDMLKSSAELVRELAAECTLFLKKDGSFPLEAPCSVALFGNGARHTVRGGTGSGEVYSDNVVNMEDGLKAAGFEITTSGWLDSYDRIVEEERAKWLRELKKQRRGIKGIFSLIGAIMPEPDYELPTDYPADACVYVLSRISGEGSDRAPVRGDILLSEAEVRDILELSGRFEKFLLVLNTGGPVDLSEVQDVRNILLFSQLGPSSGDILADILLGKSIPSGKLAASWPAWKDSPDTDFGDPDETRYEEGIYVGYRYYDTAGIKPLYPFGFGLSYTDFWIGDAEVSATGSTVSVSAKVRNTGGFAGKEVLQVYVSVPDGKLDQPYQALAAFCKTPLLKPGEECSVKASFDLKDLASFDEDTASYILEGGRYIVRVGDSSADTEPAAALILNETVTVLKAKNVFGDCGFKDIKPEKKPRAAEDVPEIFIDPSVFKTETVNYGKTYDTDPIAEGLADEELCLTAIGSFGSSPLSIIGNASSKVAGAAGETTPRLEDKGIPCLVCADGPAGLRLEREYYRDEKGIHAVNNDAAGMLKEFLPAPIARLIGKPKKLKPGTEVMSQRCTMIPTATAVAQSFDTELAEKLGSIVGSEMERYGVDLWLAPAMNIHRDMRCGRNFEYYSEDPLVSGKMAAAMTRGVQSHPGRYATIKHFAANNQETNRYGSNSLVSERALREIYLKGFGICVREAAPGAVMTSYNLINGTHTACHKGLIEDVLRAEFGFEGLVMTDWLVRIAMGGGKYPLPEPFEIAAAGGDVLMPGSKAEYKALLKALKDKKISRRQLEINASRIIKTAPGR